jgi:hypothetical protein
VAPAPQSVAIVRLVAPVVRVSLETVKVVNALPTKYAP